MTTIETVKLNVPKPTYIDTNGIKLHVMQAGYREGSPVILLHGFPEFWYGWHQQITPLAEAGYRVIVPDQRGYNLSDKPNGVSAYRVENLVADIIGLIDALEYDKVRLVGHDWGALVAWYLAMWHPERLEQLVIMNVPHPHVFKRFLRSKPEQFFRSWYAGAFQIPALPEQMLKMNDFARLATIMQRQANFHETDLRRYKEAWSQPGALTAMIHWYRALFLRRPPRRSDGRVRVPTLMLWGMEDFALSTAMAEPSIQMCEAGKLVLFKDTSHFVQHQKAARVNELMVDFFMNGLNGEAGETQVR